MIRKIFLTIAVFYSLFSFAADLSTQKVNQPQEEQAPVQVKAVAVRVPAERLIPHFHEALLVILLQKQKMFVTRVNLKLKLT